MITIIALSAAQRRLLGCSYNAQSVAVCVSCASIRHAPRATCQAAWTGALWRPTTTAASLFFLVVLPARLGPLAIVSVVYYGRLWVTCLTARRLSLREPLLYSQTNSEPNAANP